LSMCRIGRPAADPAGRRRHRQSGRRHFPRNAGTPRYGALLICILTLPFAAATILSPIPYLFLVGLQTPLYTAGMIFLLLENHKVLLDLHRSEHSNRQMAHHDLLTGLPNRALNQKLFAE